MKAMRRRWFRRDDATPDRDRLVAVTTVSAIEAELLAGQLRMRGIQCVTFSTGTAGSEPALAWSEGTRLMVRERDLQRARGIVGDDAR